MATVEFVNSLVSGSGNLIWPNVCVQLAFTFVGLQVRLAVYPNVKLRATRTPVTSTIPLSHSPDRPSAHELHMARDRQFARVVEIVETTRTRALAATCYQEEAAEKLDAADYAMHRMFTELSPIMPQFATPERAIILNHAKS